MNNRFLGTDGKRYQRDTAIEKDLSHFLFHK